MYKIIKLYILILKDKRDELNVYMYMKVVMSVVVYDYIELWYDWNVCIIYNLNEF